MLPASGSGCLCPSQEGEGLGASSILTTSTLPEDLVPAKGAGTVCVLGLEELGGHKALAGVARVLPHVIDLLSQIEGHQGRSIITQSIVASHQIRYPFPSALRPAPLPRLPSTLIHAQCIVPLCCPSIPALSSSYALALFQFPLAIPLLRNSLCDTHVAPSSLQSHPYFSLHQFPPSLQFRQAIPSSPSCYEYLCLPSPHMADLLPLPLDPFLRPFPLAFSNSLSLISRTAVASVTLNPTS